MLKQSLTGLLLLLLGLNSQPIQTAPVSKKFTASLVEPSCTISLDQPATIQLGSKHGFQLPEIMRGSMDINGIGDSGATYFSITLTDCASQISLGNEQEPKLTMRVSGPLSPSHTYAETSDYSFKDGGTSNGVGVVLYIGGHIWANIVRNNRPIDLSTISSDYIKKEGNKMSISMFALVTCADWDECQKLSNNKGLGNNKSLLKAGTLRATVKFEFFYR
jgi:type 1 fimbria pilin